jgi:hypothetical protein
MILQRGNVMLISLRGVRGFLRPQRQPARQHPRCRLTVERLEDRCLLSGPPASPPLLLPAVTIGLTDKQIDRADPVINWNAIMLLAIWTDATPPTLSSRVEAMVGVAVYDAVDGIDPVYDFYPVPGLNAQPARHASKETAAIAAAYTVLSSLYPDQKATFDAEYQASLADVHGSKKHKADGIAWGQTVGNAVLAWRSQDGSDAQSDYQAAPPGGPIGVYELTPAAGLEAKPPGFLPALAPQWGQVTPWAMTSADQFLPTAPPAVGSDEYAKAFNEVKSLGDTNSTTRTKDEYDYAHFWADVPGHSVTPPGHWDEIAEHVSLQKGLNLEENARLFALLNIGLADAGINCWDAKYIYNYWRPITAIRDPRASQINPANTSDPNWTPLWNTPNFPSYTSGHSTFSGAASTILASIFGDNTAFTNGSDDMPGYSRSFTSFTQAADEAGESRVVGGIHFSFDNVAGLTAGRQLGSYIAQNFLLPRGEDHHAAGVANDKDDRGNQTDVSASAADLPRPGVAADSLGQSERTRGASAPQASFLLADFDQRATNLIVRSADLGLAPGDSPASPSSVEAPFGTSPMTAKRTLALSPAGKEDENRNGEVTVPASGASKDHTVFEDRLADQVFDVPTA